MRLCIFGAGDNVSNRLLPAILRANIAEEVTVIHAGLDLIPNVPPFDKIERKYINPEASDYAAQINALIGGEECPIIISVPPREQIRIISAIKHRERHIVLEKPLYTSIGEREEFLRASADMNLFCFSYYTLEKAITWSYFFCPDKFLEQFIHLVSLSGSDIDAVKTSLGSLRHVDIVIKEGSPDPAGTRSTLWFETIPHGVWFDMGIHAFSLLGKITRLTDVMPATIDTRRLEEARGIFELQVRFSGCFSGVRVNIEFGKMYERELCTRYARAVFENGEVLCDFNKRKLDLLRNERAASSLKIIPELSHNYDVLVAMVSRYFSQPPRNWRDPELINQTEALEYILKLLGH